MCRKGNIFVKLNLMIIPKNKKNKRRVILMKRGVKILPVRTFLSPFFVTLTFPYNTFIEPRGSGIQFEKTFI